MSGLISMKFVSNKFPELENVVESEAMPSLRPSLARFSAMPTPTVRV